MRDWKWAWIALLALIGALLLLQDASAQGAYIHGLIDADDPAGYTVKLERWVGAWQNRGSSTTNNSGSWGIGAPIAGRYRARLVALPAGRKMIGARYPGGLNGRMDLANRAVEFNVPATGLVGDIVFIIALVPTATPIAPTITPTHTPIASLTATPTSLPVPTTLYPPTVNPTRTATPEPWRTPTPNPAVSYITIVAHTQGTIMAFQAIAMQEYVPASCFEIAATQEGCPLSVTQAWVGKVNGECWRFQPFSCPGGDGIEVAARCESPCDVGIITNGYW